MDQRNLVLAIVLSLAILLGFQFAILPLIVPQEQDERQAGQEQAKAPGAVPPGRDTLGAPAPPGMAGAGPDGTGQPISRAEMVAETPRVRIETPTLEGSISLAGGRIDDLILSQYRETIEADSERIVLLSPAGAENPYFADFGWSAREALLPDNDTIWQANGKVLTPERPITLTWDNGQGLRFERFYEIDLGYMFTVTQRVTNYGDRTETLAPYGLISRTGTPDVLGFYILHEGLLGVFDGTLSEVDYSDLGRGPGAGQDQGRLAGHHR